MTPQDARLIDAANEIHRTLDRVTHPQSVAIERAGFRRKGFDCDALASTTDVFDMTPRQSAAERFNAVRSMGSE